MKTTLTHEQASALAAHGWRCVEANDLAQGVAALADASQAAPHDHEILKALALAYARAQQPILSAQCLQVYLRAHPDDIEMLCVAGELALGMRRYRTVATLLGQCLALDPEAEHPSGVRARALIKKAEKQLQSVVHTRA